VRQKEAPIAEVVRVDVFAWLTEIEEQQFLQFLLFSRLFPTHSTRYPHPFLTFPQVCTRLSTGRNGRDRGWGIPGEYGITPYSVRIQEI
jgi:hypothetical protein